MDEAHPEMFKHGNREWKFVPKQLMHRNKINREDKTDEQRKARVEGLLQKEKERRDRFKECEIDYEFPGFSALVSLPKKAAVKPAVKEVKEAPKQEKKQDKVETRKSKEVAAAASAKPVRNAKKGKK